MPYSKLLCALLMSMAGVWLEANGSPKAKIETDEERSYFLIDIPCHPEFMKDKVVLNKDFTH